MRLSPGKYNLRFERGVAFLATWFRFRDTDGEDIDQTGWSYRAHVRVSAGAAKLATLPIVINPDDSELCGMELGGQEVTTLLGSTADGTYYWDLIATDSDGVEHRPLEGRCVFFTPITNSNP